MAMAALQTSAVVCRSSSRINAAVSLPKTPRFSAPKLRPRSLADELKLHVNNGPFPSPIVVTEPVGTSATSDPGSTAVVDHLYAVLEAISARIEMHNNLCEQRDGWNTLLLNSINMITLSATAMSAVASATDGGLALILGSTLLFAAATGMLGLMNTIQPSQLVEEQRNARRLFRGLHDEVNRLITSGSATEEDVKGSMEKVLAIDRAYPLPLIGVMLPKFPKKFEPSVWWPKTRNPTRGINRTTAPSDYSNGWSEVLESEMREILEVIKRKDYEDYERLGNLGIKLNRGLAISGPVLTGAAAIGAAFSGVHSLGSVVATVSGAAAAVVNTLEHGAQVGMVVEMYRSSGGFYREMEEAIAAALAEGDVEKRENGELFERKVALKLGRSLSELREFANRAANSSAQGNPIDEFASKLF